ncbi:MAG: hypothetical protein KGI71_06020 [Patescibacteria group bacterium]|nr:hypothetical protein [Patescibacteria group bacterium]
MKTCSTIFRPQYFKVWTIISDDLRIEPFDEKVYAAIDWFHGMKDGVCKASNQTLAELIKPCDPQPRSVQNSLNRLEECGYIRREYKDEAKRNRVRIVPLISPQLERKGDDRQKTSESVMIDERIRDDRASESVMTRVRIVSKNRSKDIAATSAAQAPFSLSEEIRKMEADKRRDLNIIALYFDERKPDLRTKAQFQEALRRHLRAAKSLVAFNDDQIIKGMRKAKQSTTEWTLETIGKMLTK